jgi:hypothetical protein
MQNTNQKAVVKMAMQFNQEELEQRQAAARTQQLEGYYQPSEYGNGRWLYPCSDKHSWNSFQLALEFTQESVKAGRELFPFDHPEHSGLYFSASFWKSNEEIQVILEASDALVAADYQAEIADHNQQQIELLTTQLYEQQKAKEQKIQDDKDAKALAAAKAEAEKFIQSQLGAKQ